MFNARRIYIYVVSLISYAAVFFAGISLLQDLLLPGVRGGSFDMALQIAILIVAAPIYLGHWFWQQRILANDDEERGDLSRRIYLYVMMAGAVVVLMVDGYGLLDGIVNDSRTSGLSFSRTPWQSLFYYLIPMGLAVATWLYHALLLRQDQASYPDIGARGSIRRLYLYAFSAAGLTLVSLAMMDTISWLLSEAGGGLLDVNYMSSRFESIIPQMVVGQLIWLAFWIQAQRLFRSGGEEEKSALLRKFYLYTVIFVGVVGAVTVVALLLSSMLQKLMGLPTEGSLADVIARLSVFGALWFYHSRVLSEDAAASSRTEQQEEIRRIYWYLLSAVGLGALLTGLVGDISTLLYIVEEGMSDPHRMSLSYFTATLIAGLPVWLVAWSKVQQEASLEDRVGARARTSIVRRIYLYLYLLLSIMTVLGSAVFVVYKLLEWVLSRQAVTLTEVSIPLTMAVVGILVWFYHLATLRTDRKLSTQDEVRQLSDMRLALVSDGETAALEALTQRLKRAAPDLELQTVQIGSDREDQDVAAQLEDADVIVAPWTVYLANDSTLSATSSAQKIVLPEESADWHWVGMEKMSADQMAEEALAMMKKIVAGEEVGFTRRWGCGAVAIAIVGLILLVIVLANTIPMLFYGY